MNPGHHQHQPCNHSSCCQHLWQPKHLRWHCSPSTWHRCVLHLSFPLFSPLPPVLPSDPLPFSPSWCLTDRMIPRHFIPLDHHLELQSTQGCPELQFLFLCCSCSCSPESWESLQQLPSVALSSFQLSLCIFPAGEAFLPAAQQADVCLAVPRAVQQLLSN